MIKYRCNQYPDCGFDISNKGHCAVSEDTQQVEYEGMGFVAVSGRKKEVIYVAHPVSGAPIDNVFRTVRWIEYLTGIDPTRVYVAPWIGEVLAFPGKLGETKHRPWNDALTDDEEVLSRFDGILAVGGRITDGMQREIDCATRLHKSVTDMSQYVLPEHLPDGFFLDPAY